MIPSLDANGDGFPWSGTSEGNFSIMSAYDLVSVGSSGLRIIRKGRGVQLIITRPLLIKNLPFLGFYYVVKKIKNRKET